MARRTDRKTESKRAAIYARVSDKSQDTEDKTSISEQISDMEAYCEEEGLTIVARYQEVGRGWSKKRHEFQRMLADARMGRFDTIVCWKSDRLSRGMYPAAALIRRLRQSQCIVQLAAGQQPSVRGDGSAAKLQPYTAVETERGAAVGAFTHWVPPEWVRYQELK